MELLATVAFSLAVIAYSVACTLYFLDLLRPPSEPTRGRATAVLVAAVICHGLHIVAASLLSHLWPLGSINFALSSAALVVALSFLALRAGREIDALGAFVGPLSLTFLLASQFAFATLPEWGGSKALLILHVAANLLGLGFVLLAGGTSIFYLVLERRLKAKKLRQLQGRLPSLDVLDGLGHRLLLSGFPLLTIGVVSGALFFTQLGALSGLSFARAILGYATWLLVAFVLLSRALFGFRGRRSAYGTLCGVLCLTLVLAVYLLRPFWGAVT